MRFVNRQDRDIIWMNKEKIKNSKDHSSAFFTQDCPKEIADERAKLGKFAKDKIISKLKLGRIRSLWSQAK